MSGRGFLIWGGRGVLIGLAMLIPGLSGGTVALVMGFYHRLLGALSRPSWRRVLPLAVGAAAGILGGSRIVGLLAGRAPDHLGAFLVGLVAVTAVAVFPRGPFRIATPVLFASGAILGWLAAGLNTSFLAGGPGEMAAMAGAGLLASAALVLPGVSGASLLVMIGQYEPLLRALNTWNFAFLILFLGGGVVGILTVSRLLMAALSAGRAATLSLLGGMMLGSVRALWPSQVSPTILLSLAGGLVLMLFLKRGWRQCGTWTITLP